MPSSPQVCAEDLPGARELSSLGPRVQPAARWGPVLPGCAMGPPNLSAPLTGPQFPHHKMKGPSSRSHTLTPVGGPGVCVGDKQPRSRTRFSTLAGWGLGTTVGRGEGAQTSEQAPQPGVREKRVHEGQTALCPRTWEGRGAGRHPAGGAGRCRDQAVPTRRQRGALKPPGEGRRLTGAEGQLLAWSTAKRPRCRSKLSAQHRGLQGTGQPPSPAWRTL